jgi:hypothetical protein
MRDHLGLWALDFRGLGFGAGFQPRSWSSTEGFRFQFGSLPVWVSTRPPRLTPRRAPSRMRYRCPSDSLRRNRGCAADLGGPDWYEDHRQSLVGVCSHPNDGGIRRIAELEARGVQAHVQTDSETNNLQIVVPDHLGQGRCWWLTSAGGQTSGDHGWIDFLRAMPHLDTNDFPAMYFPRVVAPLCGERACSASAPFDGFWPSPSSGVLDSTRFAEIGEH